MINDAGPNFSQMNTEFGAKFSYTPWHFDVKSGELRLTYSDSKFGDFEEVFNFPEPDIKRYQQLQSSIDAAIDCLHWMAGVSYYKTALAKRIHFNKNVTRPRPNHLQAQWLRETWQHGLAELAFNNQLTWLAHIKFEAGPNQTEKIVETAALSPQSLVAIGGGKDSLVSIEAIKAMGEQASLFMVGQSSFIESVSKQTGLPLLQVVRKVDPKLKVVNDQGAFNGHVPITAINACVAVVAALLYNFDSVVFSNERSADVGNVKLDSGQWVNHQYSKSLPYEDMWQQIIAQHIASDLHCFSLLRPFSELAIVKKFASHKNYFPHFSSCNRNFHLSGSKNQQHHWCGRCPKCAFVFLCLAPYLSRSELLSIFNKNLFSDMELNELFESLLGIAGLKPFECVGEQQECRLALQLLAEHPEWQSQKNIQQWLKALPHLNELEMDEIMQASQNHLIPSKRNFLQAIVDAT